jgi:hypothetical protein
MLLAVLGVSTAIGLAAPAYADPGDPSGDDAGFLAALQQVGIKFPSPLQPSVPAKRCAGA